MKYLWNSIKHSKTHVIGVPEERREKELGRKIKAKEIKYLFWNLISTHESGSSVKSKQD